MNEPTKVWIVIQTIPDTEYLTTHGVYLDQQAANEYRTSLIAELDAEARENGCETDNSDTVYIEPDILV